MGIRFLNEQGALLVAPYKALSQGRTLEVFVCHSHSANVVIFLDILDCRERSTEVSMFPKLHYAIISDEKRIQVRTYH